MASLALKWASKKEGDWSFVLSQIQGIQIASRKIPSWAVRPLLIYPDKTALEQCSSEVTAQFKSQLMKGKNVADLTGGMGVDSYFIAQQASQHTYIEPDSTRFEITKHNFEVLGITNTTFLNCTAEEFLANPSLTSIDCIYVDPSRRNENHKRVFLLKDMQPDLELIMNRIRDLHKKMFIKLSPMLDIKATISELKNVKTVYVVSVEDECKELLFEIDFSFNDSANIQSVNISNKGTQLLCFTFKEEAETNLHFSTALKYLYDPFSSLNKAGGYKSIANIFEVSKISQNTHLYTSENLVQNFFGNCFEIVKVDDFSTKLFPANEPKKGVIKIRNFKLTQQEIEKKTKITYGTEYFYFFYSDSQQQLKVATTKKVY
ncbi:MAG: hypothetical protein ACKOX3_04210 [Bacteroidota bacterium]